MSDSTRTATEQMLISDAMDRAISNLDLRALAGRQIYLETAFLRSTVDCEYLISSFRQHALASGCILKAKPEQAEFIVELRAGAVGTDRHDVLFGIPATTVPTGGVGGGTMTMVPEIPFVKKTDQRAVAKVAVFAYSRVTGRPVWQSGLAPTESTSKSLWVLGAGPFRRGSIYDGTHFAGDKVRIPLVEPGPDHGESGALSVATEAFFTQPPETPQLAQREIMPVGQFSNVTSAGTSPKPSGPTAGTDWLLPPLAGAASTGSGDASLLPPRAQGAAGAGGAPAAGASGVPNATATAEDVTGTGLPLGALTPSAATSATTSTSGTTSVFNQWLERRW
jgi:hypothetical protein